MPFRYLQLAADELRCSVMEAADADPEWRQYAIIKLLAGIESERRRETNGVSEQ